MDIIQRFNINIGKGVKDYYSVSIFSEKREMIQFFKGMGVIGDFESITHSFTLAKMKGEIIKELPLCGLLAFYEGGITPAVVSHEISHALNHYWKNKGLDFNLGKVDKKWFDNDEMYATVQGYMVDEFFRQYKGKFKKH